MIADPKSAVGFEPIGLHDHKPMQCGAFYWDAIMATGPINVLIDIFEHPTNLNLKQRKQNVEQAAFLHMLLLQTLGSLAAW